MSSCLSDKFWMLLDGVQSDFYVCAYEMVKTGVQATMWVAMLVPPGEGVKVV